MATSAPLYSQTITVNPNTLEDTQSAALINENAFFVNGVLTQGLTQEMARSFYTLGPMSRTLITLGALRMNAAGLLSLDEPIAATLPDSLQDNPFRVGITTRHILTETAGFAVPPIFGPNAPFQNYLTQVRTAGQMTHADPVGWRLLILFLEAKSGQTIDEILVQFVLNPLGHEAQDLKFPAQNSALDWPSRIEANGGLIADLARLSVRNRDKSGSRFLPPDLYEQFATRHNWRMHPVGPRRTLGGTMKEIEDRTYISPPALQNGMGGATYIAFPDQGLAFVRLSGPGQAQLDAIKALAQNQFLPAPNDRRLAEAKGLYDKDIIFNGAYVRSDAPSAWLKDRLDGITGERVSLADRGTGTLTAHQSNGEAIIFTKKAPYLFETLIGERIILSPYRQGGYLVLDDTLYRYVGVLGNSFFVLDIFPWVMLVLFSSIFHIRSHISPRWRKMAQFGVLGSTLVLGGLAADYYLWPQAVFIWDMPWVVNIWRAAINIGLALVLSLPLFALSFTRQNEMPKGATIFIVPLHLGLLSTSAFMLFLILVAWGVAGEFSAF